MNAQAYPSMEIGYTDRLGEFMLLRHRDADRVH